MNRLDDFIKTHREDFDTELPSLRVWAALDAQLEGGKRKTKVVSMRQYFSIAASVLLLISIGAGLGVYFTKGDDLKTAAVIKEVAPEFQEAERYYNAKVAEKTAKLVSLNAADDVVNQDLQQIDQVMEELRGALVNAPKGSREQIIAQMIATYKAKVTILENVLDGKEKANSNPVQKMNQPNQKNL